MKPGAVLIWPVDATHDEVAPIDRISFGAERITIILGDRRRVPLLADVNTVVQMKATYDEARYIRLTQAPVILPP